MDCIFCKIAHKQLATTLLYEDDTIIAFNDIKPQAPQHVLIIPKNHIATLNDLNLDQAILAGKMMLVGQQLAKKLNFAEQGYRLVFNCNQHGGQEVQHIHLHLLGGRQMHWPPG